MKGSREESIRSPEVNEDGAGLGANHQTVVGPGVASGARFGGAPTGRPAHPSGSPFRWHISCEGHRSRYRLIPSAVPNVPIPVVPFDLVLPL